MSASKTQEAMIAAHLRKHGSLTPLEALSKFGCHRLAARVYDLRSDSMPIWKETVKVRTRYGHAKVARYRYGTA